MRIVFSIALVVLLSLPSITHAAKQTISLQAGPKTLTFEAPRGQCFVDRTSPVGSMIHRNLGMHHGQYSRKRLLAIMIGCNAVSPETTAQGLATILLNTTRIYWLNTDFGDTVENMSRYQFFTEYEKYVRKDGLMSDKEFVRNQYHTSTYAENILRDQIGAKPTFTTRSGLTIKDVPLEIIASTSTKYVNLSQKYAELDELIKLQIQINE